MNKSSSNFPNYPNFSFRVECLKEIPSSTSPSYVGNEKSYDASMGRARIGYLHTPHGVVETPNFIFCGTKATVKAIPAHQLKDLHTQIILANTYHLMLQPGSQLIARQGGLHRFMNWSGPMLTDSGGYQIFAMGHESVSQEIKKTQQTLKKSLLKVDEQGATFRSYLNGDKIFLSPEISIQVQRELGADLIVQLDECTPFHIDKKQTEQSMHLSLRWGERSLQAFRCGDDGSQAIYGVVQGGVYPDLRKISTQGVLGTDFFGIAIGGSLGENRQQMKEVVGYTCEELYGGFSQSGIKPIHLLGIGKVADIFYGVREGIDTFDCVHPTRMARHGWAILPASTHEGGQPQINLHNSRFKNDQNPIDPSKDLSSSQKGILESENYSRAYLHHLLKAQEITALSILSSHNVFQMNRLMRDIRQGIKENCLEAVEQFWCGSA